MLIPVAAVSVMLAMLADEEEVFARRVRQRAFAEGWVPPSGALQGTHLRVPRRWFHTHPHLVPPPFSWPSTRSASIVEHPYRTMHVLLTVDDFIALTSTPLWSLERKTRHMREHYLPAARAMLRGDEVPNFPLPWLQIRYDSGHPYISGHEGRHRAMMARDLGLEVLPVVLVISEGPQQWEHHRESIETDPVVEMLTRGGTPFIRTQDHGPERGLPPRYMSLEPRTAEGKSLGYELTRLKLTLDPTLRNPP